ncbi:MAG: helix-turn-helix domain-containing protein [Bacteroidales bacterium]
MIYKVIEPNDALKPYVHSIQLTDMNKGERLNNQKIAPYGYSGLFFTYKGSCSKTDNICRKFSLPRSFIAGLTDQSVTFNGEGSIGTIAVNFYPTGLYHFLKSSVSEITNATLNSSDVVGPEMDRLFDQITNTKDDNEKLNLVEKFLLYRFDFDGLLHTKSIETAQKLLMASNGQIKIHQLAQQSCMSISSLERHFHQQVGLLPKSYANILRFNHVFKLIKHYGSNKWQDIIYKCGYYDQASFIRDFSRYTGETPRRFFLSEFRVSDFFSGK